MAATEIALGRELRPNETVDAGLSRTWTALWAIFLVALRLPFLATHNVQEDAYISLRCARNIALGLGYGFNAGERVNASTAHAFVFLASLVCRIFGTAYYIPVWQLMCTCFIVGAVYCIASAVSSSDRERDLMWILGSATPIAILISILALETSLLILLIAVLILDLRRPLPRLLPLLSIALLPWVRADAVAIGLIYLVCQVLRDRRPNWLNAAALAAGAGGILIFNRLYFGQWLNQSIVAKQSFRLVYPAPRAFFTNLQGLFLGLGREGIRNVFSPWRSEFVGHIEPLFSLVGLAACLWLARVAWRTRELRAPLTALLAVGFLMPIPYAWSNWLFHWYFHPSMFCFAMLVVLAVLKLGGIARPVLRPYILCAFALLLACLAAGQWALSLNWGTQDYYFIAGVGRHLRSIAARGDTLFLEPAGYIPYYSELYTWDEVGIVSPEVTRFQQRYGTHWWVDFVQAKRPTFLVQRPTTIRLTIAASTLTPEERAWLDRHYKLIDRVAYHPEAYYRNRILQRIAALGTSSDLLVYKFIPESGSTER